MFSPSFVAELTGQIGRAREDLLAAQRDGDAAATEVALGRLQDLLQLAEDGLTPVRVVELWASA